MSFVIVSEIDQVAYVKMHRPDVRNAVNPDMIDQLTETFQKLSIRKDVRLIAFQGEGKVFCAGADLTWMKSMVNFSFDQNKEDSLKLFQMFESMMKCSIPIIGVVQGAAFGGALGLLACCDYVIAEEGTKYCFSEVKLGIAPAVISAFVMPKVVHGMIRPLMISGDIFENSVALASGLIHKVVPQTEGHTELQKVIHRMKEGGPEAAREIKKLLNDLTGLSWEQQKERTTKLIAERRISSEGQEGLKSFLEKRSPAWMDE